MGQPQTLLTGMTIEQLSCTFIDEKRLKINSTLAFQYRNTEKICPLKPLVSSIFAGRLEVKNWLVRSAKNVRDVARSIYTFTYYLLFFFTILLSTTA